MRVPAWINFGLPAVRGKWENCLLFLFFYEHGGSIITLNIYTNNVHMYLTFNKRKFNVLFCTLAKSLTNAFESFSAMHAKVKKPAKKKQTNTKRAHTHI